MNKLLFGLLFISSMLFAEITHIEATPKFLKKTKLKIIDIRTESEWVMHGIIEDAFLLTFFDRFGHYDIDVFKKKLDNIIDKGEKFAIICHVGSRTKMLSNLLGKNMKYNVVDLKGGMVQLINRGYKPTSLSLSISQK
ncbi:rhodanese-like domain-containing protein [Sulfurovum sp. bin170]|uniref:rhodanese-like domain-containing protein n=1 Tax=Sulfurovum sp. bin170 TaxID=2695268 RepID=UPI0013DF7CEF|nr:rhodanese-like domain-containing protein [Sulfurovum sp. bin170]NEW60017.1 rhodanese-like domain-containing protein [Sulfurovum sp. bin170]